ncbi:MAG: cytidine deaminase [Bacteroidales bacterium]|nr:cytidine deaminase [Bacteroidales bacterium]
MEKRLTVIYHLIPTRIMLDSHEKELVEQAELAAGNAYAPYSGFKVGAAVRLTNGLTITGNNQENAAFPSSICAEQVAIAYARANYPGTAIVMIAIVASTANGTITDPVTPCGNCRQVLLEVEQSGEKPIVMLCAGKEKTLRFTSIQSLMPLSFSEKYLKM